jgi:hypothetical protein
MNEVVNCCNFSAGLLSAKLSVTARGDIWLSNLRLERHVLTRVMDVPAVLITPLLRCHCPATLHLLRIWG